MKYQKIFIIFLLNFAILFADQTAFANHSGVQSTQIFLADRYFRSELYFGTDIPGGGKVSAEEWDKFLEAEVTPRFPDGFTVLEGYGQFKGADGKIVREASRILVLFYPKKQREVVDLKIEEIRTNYKKQFKQESVLRLDFRKSVNIDF